jgi:hypothetical protein
MRTPPNRSPGSAGLQAQGAPIVTRGPIGLVLVSNTALPKNPTPVVGVAPKVAPILSNTLPPPDHQWSKGNKVAQRFPDRKLFEERAGPSQEDVRQQGVANCYLAALLAALARTPNGRIRLRKMVAPHAGSFVTVARDYDGEKPGAERKITADRYFEIALAASQPIAVSDVLYATDGDRDYDPVFMDSPQKLLWPSVIELAYATFCGGYDQIGSDAGISWARCITDVLGKVDYIKLNLPRKTWDRAGSSGEMGGHQLDELLGGAATKPTIIVTGLKGKLLPHHAYAVVRHDTHSTTVYDPLTALAMPVVRSDLKGACEEIISISA